MILEETKDADIDQMKNENEEAEVDQCQYQQFCLDSGTFSFTGNQSINGAHGEVTETGNY